MYKNKITIVIIVLAILLGVFSWYEIRPYYIRNKCIAEARKNAVLDTNQPQYYKDDLIDRTKLQGQLMEEGYLNCVREHGLAQWIKFNLKVF